MEPLGFTDDSFRFFADLAQDNSREFWTAHRDRYDAAVREPMLALLDAMALEFGTGRLFRPNRDIRFSPDKRPYKEHAGAFVPAGPDTGYYVHIDVDGLLVGVGWYRSTPEQVARFRAAVNEPRLLPGLRGAIATAVAHGLTLDGEQVPTRPRGVDRDDPNLDLLRHRTLTAGRRYGAEEPWLTTDEVEERVRGSWRVGRPLVEWLVANAVGPVPS